MLVRWSSDLLASPASVAAIEKILTSDFMGTSFLPVQSQSVRRGAAIEVRRVTFGKLLEPEPFLQELRSAMGGFSTITTAEFQVTRIGIDGDRVETRVRYELVGAGRDFYREQRAGFWELEWKAASPGTIVYGAGKCRKRCVAGRKGPVTRILRHRRSLEIRLTRSRCCMESTIGARFSMARAASIYTAITECRSETSIMTVSTTCTFASRRVCPTGSIETAVTERLKTSPRAPA